MKDFVKSFCEGNLQFNDMSQEELLAFGIACESLGIENVPDVITEDEFNRLSRVLFAMNDAMEESEVEVITEEEYNQRLAERALAEQAEAEAAIAVENETIKTLKGEKAEEEKDMTNNKSNVNVNEAAQDAVKFTEHMKDAAVNAGKRVYNYSKKVRDFFDSKANMTDEEFEAYVEGHIDYISNLIKDTISRKVESIDDAKFDEDDEDTYENKLDREAKETIFTILDESYGQSKWKTFKQIVVHVAKWFFNIIKRIAMLALKLIAVLVIGTLKIACVAGSTLFKAGTLVINDGVKPACSGTKDFCNDFKEYRKAKKVTTVEEMMNELDEDAFDEE